MQNWKKSPTNSKSDLWPGSPAPATLPSSGLAPAPILAPPTNPAGKPIARVTPVTSVVDSHLRKTSPKPPVLSPKPNSSEVVKRLSFKREGQDVPAKREAGASTGQHGEQEAVDKRSTSHKAPASVQDTDSVTEREHRPGPESRVSSMIARLSNGSSEPQNSTIRTDRQNFMSKIIKNEPEMLGTLPGVDSQHNGTHHIAGDVFVSNTSKEVNNDKSKSDGRQDSSKFLANRDLPANSLLLSTRVNDAGKENSAITDSASPDLSKTLPAYDISAQEEHQSLFESLPSVEYRKLEEESTES